MPHALLPFAYDVIRSHLVAALVPGDARSTDAVRSLVAALPPVPAASVSDMRVLMTEVLRGRLRTFSDDRALLEPGATLAVPLAFIAQTALEHDGSSAWSPEEWDAELRRSRLWPLTLAAASSARGTDTED